MSLFAVPPSLLVWGVPCECSVLKLQILVKEEKTTKSHASPSDTSNTDMGRFHPGERKSTSRSRGLSFTCACSVLFGCPKEMHSDTNVVVGRALVFFGSACAPQPSGSRHGEDGNEEFAYIIKGAQKRPSGYLFIRHCCTNNGSGTGVHGGRRNVGTQFSCFVGGSQLLGSSIQYKLFTDKLSPFGNDPNEFYRDQQASKCCYGCS